MKRTGFYPIDIITINYSAHQYNGKAISEVMLNNGRIGMAIFQLENNSKKYQKSSPNAFPADNYAKPPVY